MLRTLHPPVTLAASLAILLAAGCEKKEPSATGTPSASSVAEPSNNAAAKLPPGNASIEWPSKLADDIVIGSLNEVEKDSTCTIVVLRASVARDNPKARENVVAFLSAQKSFVDGKSCPSGEHLKGMCYSKQFEGYGVFYNKKGPKTWTENEAKAACAKALGKWME